jgi:hypothetical protein
MPSRTKAQLAKHYKDYQGKPEQIAKRSERNKARRLMEKKVGKDALKGKDVDHIKPMRSGGKTSTGNLRIRSIKSNRGDTK